MEPVAFNLGEQVDNHDEPADWDWGAVEQAAVERLDQENTENVSLKEFLDWLSDLEYNSNQIDSTKM